MSLIKLKANRELLVYGIKLKVKNIYKAHRIMNTNQKNLEPFLLYYVIGMKYLPTLSKTNIRR